MEMSEGRRLHGEAAKAREAGDPVASLSANDQALMAYDLDQDSLGFAEGIACRSITLRNYGNEHTSRRFLILAKSEMLGSVQIARESGEKEALGLPLYNLAQLHEDLGEFPEAIHTYKEAIDLITTVGPVVHNVPAFVATMQVHLATTEYKSGDRTALQRAEEAVSAIAKADEPRTFNKDVWLSGGYMRLADILRSDDPAKAKDYLAKAKKIIDANPELVLRKKQVEQLIETFKL